MVIRPMKPEDAAHCARMMVETPLWQQHGVTFQTAQDRFLAGLEAGAGLFVMADEDDPNHPIVGFVWCVVRGAFDRSGYIRLLAVDGRRRGRGLGALLLQHAEVFLAQAAPDVFLLVSDFNHEAQRFYRRHGYTQIGAVPDYVSPGVAELLYHKRLTPEPPKR